MKAGLIDAGSAAEDIMETEKRLHALIDGLRVVAGIEGDGAEEPESSSPPSDGQ
jgi:hypothetical protein